MRTITLAALLLLSMTVTLAQDATTLSVKQALVAVRIAHPVQQLTQFAPILQRVDATIAKQAKGTKANRVAMNATVAMKGLLDKYSTLPGINPDGDLWFVVMPPTKFDAIAANLEKKDPKALNDTPAYLLVPLKDPEAFKTAGDFAKDAVICGNYGLVSPVEVKTLPKYTAVDTEYAFLTKCDIAATFNTANSKLDGIEKSVPPMAQMFLAPMLEIVKEYQSNFQHTEIGLKMEDKDLVMESFAIPVPDSALAKSLTVPDKPEVALQCAGYLPDNLLYCSAGSSMLQGSPGLARLTVRIGTGMLSAFLPPVQYEPFEKSLQALEGQCSQGRAFGITSSKVDGTNTPTFVGVYRVANSAEATSAVRNFVLESIKLRDGVMDGQLTTFIKIFTKYGVEKVGDVPVDLVKVILPFSPADIMSSAVKPTPMIVECRATYLGEYMLVTIGPDSKLEMAGLVTRVQAGTPCYTNSPRFQAVKAALPEGARGFETISTTDTMRTLIMTLDNKKDLAKDLKRINALPATQGAISTYMTVEGDHLRGAMRIPADQWEYIFSAIDWMMEDDVPAKVGPTKPTTKPPAKPTTKPAAKPAHK